MLPFYKAEILKPDGSTLLPIEDIIKVEAARAFGQDGSCTLTIPADFPRTLFRLHTRMKLWRHDYQGVPRNFGKTLWFLKKLDYSHSENSLALTFVDSFAMLKGRLVAYPSDSTYASKTMEEMELVDYNDNLRLDNMMRAYVRENMGPDALDTDRIIPGITIEDDRNLGPYGEKQAAWQELGATISDLARMSSAKGVDLYYDLLPEDDGTFTFKVWTGIRGVDRGQGSTEPLILTEESGLISDIHEIEDYSNVASFCYGLGEGSGGSQLVESGENLTIIHSDAFGRLEMTVNAADTSNIRVLADTAIAALEGRLPKRSLQCNVVENSTFALGRDIDFGDRVIVQVGSAEYNCVLNALATSWEEGEEQLDLRLSGDVPIGSKNIFQEVIIPDPLPDPDPDDPNLAPEVDAGDDAAIDWGLAYPANGSASDDGLPNPPAALTYTWTQTSGPADGAHFGEPNSLICTVTFDEPGVYVLRLTVSDSDLVSFDELTVTVGDRPNEAPTVDAGPDQSIADGTTMTLSGTVDDDGLPDPPATVTTLWTMDGGPAAVTFDDDTALTTDVTYSMPGLYQFRLTADDSDLTAYDQVYVNVGETGNEPPEVDAGPDETISYGMGLIMAGGAIDDGLPLVPGTVTVTWTQTGGPATATITDIHDPNTFVTFPATGLYSFRLTADDGDLTAYDDMFVLVTV